MKYPFLSFRKGYFFDSQKRKRRIKRCFILLCDPASITTSLVKYGCMSVSVLYGYCKFDKSNRLLVFHDFKILPKNVYHSFYDSCSIVAFSNSCFLIASNKSCLFFSYLCNSSLISFGKLTPSISLMEA